MRSGLFGAARSGFTEARLIGRYSLQVGAQLESNTVSLGKNDSCDQEDSHRQDDDEQV